MNSKIAAAAHGYVASSTPIPTPVAAPKTDATAATAVTDGQNQTEEGTAGAHGDINYLAAVVMELQASIAALQQGA